jgi:hypothetical protein
VDYPNLCRSTLIAITMDANLYSESAIPSTEQPQHVIDISSSPSVPSNAAPTCVHIREEDSHCEQCRQQIRSMSRSMLQQPSQLDLPATLDRSIDPCYAVANNLRQRRRASHFPSASDTSMSSLFPSSPRDTTSPVPTHPWRESRGSCRPSATQPKRRDSPASVSLTRILRSSRNASARSQLSQSFSAA